MPHTALCIRMTPSNPENRQRSNIAGDEHRLQQVLDAGLKHLEDRLYRWSGRNPHRLGIGPPDLVGLAQLEGITLRQLPPEQGMLPKLLQAQALHQRLA